MPTNPASGGSPTAAIAATNEWFPKKERAFAIGIFNAGANIGAIVTPLLVSALVASLLLDWRWAFIITGLFNLVWLGAAPLGVLDFQDAVAVHPAYDLVSALQDARRDVDPALEQAQIARYVAASGQDEGRFRAAYALLGAQRSLRIMGIFTRLCLRDGKPRYGALCPRVWRYLERDLAHPALAGLRTWHETHLPSLVAPRPDADPAP